MAPGKASKNEEKSYLMNLLDGGLVLARLTLHPGNGAVGELLDPAVTLGLLRASRQPDLAVHAALCSPGLSNLTDNRLCTSFLAEGEQLVLSEGSDVAISGGLDGLRVAPLGSLVLNSLGKVGSNLNLTVTFSRTPEPRPTPLFSVP